jgi:hypothetical protein
VSTLVGGLVGGPESALVIWLIGGLGSGLVGGLILGLGLGLKNGGAACLQHLVLRCLLVRNDFAPWKVVTFLDSAAELILLHKVGGGTIFVHRLLLEWYARRAEELGVG